MHVNQKYEFTVFPDDDFDQDTTLTFGQIEVTNPLMNDIQTGLDTLQVNIGAGSSTYNSDANPDYTLPDWAYFFTGDINTTGTKVQEPGNGADGYIDVNGTTYYRWGNGNPPGTWLNKIGEISADVFLTLPADSTVRVSSGDQIEIPLTITPEVTKNTEVAGFEFEIEFKSDELNFIDMKTDILPGPWMTYLNESEIDDYGYKTISFGALENSPNNAPQDYYITEEMVGLELVFNSTCVSIPIVGTTFMGLSST